MKLALSGIWRRVWPVRSTAAREVDLAPAVSNPDHDHLRGIVDGAPDGLLACDAVGRLTLVNPAAASLLGIETRQAGGADEWPAGALCVRPALEQALLDRWATLELEVEHGDRTLQLEGRASAIVTDAGQIDGAVLALRDVTRLRELAGARADDWQTLAHDLKVPLNSIGGFTTLLLQEAVGPLNPLQRDFLRTIEQEGQRLLQAVQGFLEDTCAGATAPRLSQTEVKLRPVIDETLDRVRALAARKSLTVQVDVPDNLPTVEADVEKLGLVLMNLLDNAISFSRDGGRIAVAARETGECLEVSVRDEGAGIPPDALELIFSRFYRAPNQPSGSRPGVGLGLAICKQVVERHGGRIWAESGPEGGAKLAFTLPVAYRQARLEALGAAW